MAKFCAKCGAKLNKKTGECSQCSNELKNNKTPGTKKEKRKKSKKTGVKIIVILVLLIVIAAVTTGFMVYSGKLDIPIINDVLVSLGFQDEDRIEDHNDDEADHTEDDGTTDSTTNQDEVPDLGDNYEVPEFDADKYFEENTTLISTSYVNSSQYVSTESDAYNNFYERGFDGRQVTYDYTLEGEYVGENTISRYSSSKHPMYQTYYTTSLGDVWVIYEINGLFYAMPLTYDYSDENNVTIIFSETDTITSYDSTSNKFYVNIPNESQIIIKTVSRIDAETIENMNQ